MEFIWKRLKRRPILTLVRLVLAAALCLLLCLLSRYRAEQGQQLQEIQSSFDVLCVVTNRSGTQSEALRMPPLTMSVLTMEDSPLRPYIRDLRLTKEFDFSAAGLGISQGQLLGVTNERCREELDPARGGSVHLLRQDFYESADPLILVSQAVYDHLEHGSVTLTVTDPYVDQRENPEQGGGTLEVTVAGWYAGSGETVYLPFPAATMLAVSLSGRMSCDSAAFLAADNTKLDELKRAASGSFGSVDPQAGRDADPRYALQLHDESYLETVALIEQNLRQVGILLPIAILLTLGEGFLLCFLSARGEVRSYALMRTLGQTRSRLLGWMLAEQLLPPFLAALIVGSVLGSVLPALVFLVCHAAGCLAASVRTVRIRPSVLLRNTED